MTTSTRPRRAHVRLLGLLLAGLIAGCGSASPDDPTGLAFAENTATIVAVVDDVDTLVEQTEISAFAPQLELLDAVREEDLPNELGPRMDLLNQWLRGVGAARNSGNGAHSVGADSAFSIEMFVNTSDPAEAQDLCPLYVSAARTYGGALAQPREITLSGWVMTESGMFADAGWPTITCELA